MSNKTKPQLVSENFDLKARVTQLEAELAKRRRVKDPPTPSTVSVERKRIAAALEASEVRYRRLFETAKDGILILDAKTGLITDSNPYLEKMLGYAHTDLMGKQLWEIGSFKDVAANQAAFRQLQSKKFIRYEDLPLEAKNGERRQVEFISNVYLVDHTRVIQCNIRDITDRKLAEKKIRTANERLASLVEVLQRRDHELTALNHMNDLLQTCETLEEAYRIIPLTVAKLFVGRSGCVAVFQASGQDLETTARWGEETFVEDVFPMKDCWALRRGQRHAVVDPETDLVCNHFVHPLEGGSLCLPLTVRGKTLGVLCFATNPTDEDGPYTSEHQLAVMVGETIKLSLANLKLQTTLLEQATRDPLTGLFNRRYLADTLPRELHGVIRRESSLSLAMIDLDHFKQFNDMFGHEAGDLMLHELGRMLKENMRKSDIACRYGGEEFVLVLPDSSLSDAIERLEEFRLLFETREIRQGGRLLATMTFSAGIAEAPQHGSTPAELLRAADDALYAAKGAGRNRVVGHERSDYVGPDDVVRESI